MSGELGNLDRRFLSRLFPGFRLVGAIRMAFDLRKLTIAALGLALLQLGWSILDWLLPGSVSVTPATSVAVGAGSFALGVGSWGSDFLGQLHVQLSQPFRDLLTLLQALFDPRSSWAAMLHAILGLTWLFVIWGICGGAICRIAVVRVAAMRQTGVGEALRFSLRSVASLVLAPFYPFLGLVFCAAVIAAFGLIYRLPAVGSALAGVLLVVPLGIGLIMTLMAAGLAAGWPLLHAAVAAGAEDAIDAVSRTFGYLNQRIGSFGLLAGFAWVEGMFGLFLMNLLAGGVVRLTEWGLGLTGPAAHLAAIFGGAGGASLPVATAAHAFWFGVVRLVIQAWAYSFFWTAAALLYLWLRHDVDGTPWDEIEASRVQSSAQIRPRAAEHAPQASD